MRAPVDDDWGSIFMETPPWNLWEAKSCGQKAKPPGQVAESDRTYRAGEYAESVQRDTMRTAFCGTQLGTALPEPSSAMDLGARRWRRAMSRRRIRFENEASSLPTIIPQNLMLPSAPVVGYALSESAKDTGLGRPAGRLWPPEYVAMRAKVRSSAFRTSLSSGNLEVL
jgi:hypothetical protein